MPMFWMLPRADTGHTTAMPVVATVAAGRSMVTTGTGATATGATGAEVTHPPITIVGAR